MIEAAGGRMVGTGGSEPDPTPTAAVAADTVAESAVRSVSGGDLMRSDPPAQLKGDGHMTQAPDAEYQQFLAWKAQASKTDAAIAAPLDERPPTHWVDIIKQLVSMAPVASEGIRLAYHKVLDDLQADWEQMKTDAVTAYDSASVPAPEETPAPEVVGA